MPLVCRTSRQRVSLWHEKSVRLDAVPPWLVRVYNGLAPESRILPPTGLAQHFVEMSLIVPQPATDGLAQVLVLLGSPRGTSSGTELRILALRSFSGPSDGPVLTSVSPEANALW